MAGPQLSAGAGLGLVSGAVSALDSVVLTCGFLLLVAVIENPVAGVESSPGRQEGLRMRIGNLAEQTGTPVETIRFYEREGLIAGRAAV
jgi:hypothetical protein